MALIQTDKFLAAGKTRSLVGAAACCALAWQCRWIGVAAPVFTGLALLFRQGAPLRRRARDAAAVALPAMLLMAAWLLRCILIAGRLSNRDFESPVSLPLLLHQAAGILWGWVHFELPATAAVPLAAAAGSPPDANRGAARSEKKRPRIAFGSALR